jgi:hypothetical protein
MVTKPPACGKQTGGLRFLPPNSRLRGFKLLQALAWPVFRLTEIPYGN